MSNRDQQYCSCQYENQQSATETRTMKQTKPTQKKAEKEDRFIFKPTGAYDVKNRPDPTSSFLTNILVIKPVCVYYFSQLSIIS